MSEELLLAARRQVRALFVHTYQQAYLLRHGTPTTKGNLRTASWDGGYDAHHSKNHKVDWWGRIAAVCATNQIDPAAYIAAQFTNRAQLPEPSQCAGASALERYHRQARAAGDNLRIACEDQKRTLAVEACIRVDVGGLDKRTAVAAVLGDRNVQLSGLFRYLIAVRYEYPAIADRFRGPATLQYVYRRDDYERAWSGLGIPEELRRDADAIASGGSSDHG